MFKLCSENEYRNEYNSIDSLPHTHVCVLRSLTMEVRMWGAQVGLSPGAMARGGTHSGQESEDWKIDHLHNTYTTHQQYSILHCTNPDVAIHTYTHK